MMNKARKTRQTVFNVRDLPDDFFDFHRGKTRRVQCKIYFMMITYVHDTITAEKLLLPVDISGAPLHS
jgi:hypothetical protein